MENPKNRYQNNSERHKTKSNVSKQFNNNRKNVIEKRDTEEKSESQYKNRECNKKKMYEKN